MGVVMTENAVGVIMNTLVPFPSPITQVKEMCAWLLYYSGKESTQRLHI